MRFQPTPRRQLRDEFDDPNDGGLIDRILRSGLVQRYRLPLIGGALLLAVVGFSSLMVMAMSSADAASNGQVPLIRADATPYKVVPEDRGGMDVPNLGTTVFENLRDDQGKPKIENLLADDSKPAEKKDLFTGIAGQGGEVELASASRDFRGKENPLSAAEKRALQAEKNEDAVAGEAKPLPGNVQPLPMDKAVEVPVEPKIATPDPRTIDTEKVEEDGEVAAPATVAPEAEKPVEQAARPKTDEPAPKPDTSGSTYIQIASIKDRAEAPAHWSKLQAQFSSLSGADYRVRSVDLGAKGTYHRIQAGPMSLSKAESVCASIKAKQPGGCLIVKD